jgi:RimJ/RimL family protein N-acetyltransferase
MDQPTPVDGGPAFRVRRVEPDEDRTVELISTRMRLTLAEVLDPTRADEMFTDEELRERVRWHLDRDAAGRRADVFVAEDDDGVLGHTMVRVEHLDGQDVGLFATTYVDPASRRSGVASALLSTGEAWMRDRGMTIAVTFTDPHNDKLLSLYERHGYTCERIDDEWARATRSLRSLPLVDPHPPSRRRAMDLESAWPPARLRLRHRDLELRPATDDDALLIASWIPTLLPAEQHHFMPHLFAALKADTPEEMARLELQWIWRQRAAMTPDDWGLPLTVVVDGEPVGIQGVQATGFRVRRTIGSGSFLVPERRRAGIGTRARAIMLSLAFDHLGALAAESGYMDGNDASRTVSERLGYHPNGVAFHEFEGVRHRENRVLLEADRWRSVRPAWLDELDIEGVDALRRQLEVSEP